jgi:acyl carrier protein
MLDGFQQGSVSARTGGSGQPHDVYGQVETLLRLTCGLDGIQIVKDRPLIEYGIDSVRAVDLLVELEEAFGIEIPDETAYRLRTLADVTEYVKTSIANRF